VSSYGNDIKNGPLSCAGELSRLMAEDILTPMVTFPAIVGVEVADILPAIVGVRVADVLPAIVGARVAEVLLAIVGARVGGRVVAVVGGTGTASCS
jgi:hypothetical protein